MRPAVHRICCVAVAALALPASSCALLVPPLDPIVNEVREVRELSDPARTMTFHEARVWFNGPVSRATKGVRLPDGVYVLEAEDKDYLYFRAPALIQMRRIENQQTREGVDLPGGFALYKRFAIYPFGAVYVDEPPGRKVLVFLFGGEFVPLRGKLWDKSF